MIDKTASPQFIHNLPTGKGGFVQMPDSPIFASPAKNRGDSSFPNEGPKPQL